MKVKNKGLTQKELYVTNTFVLDEYCHTRCRYFVDQNGLWQGKIMTWFYTPTIVIYKESEFKNNFETGITTYKIKYPPKKFFLLKTKTTFYPRKEQHGTQVEFNHKNK